jgi:putative ABC transport system substrate-binding protein
MRRRILLQFGAAMLAWPALLLAQTAKRFRVGGLFLADEAFVKPFEEAFLAGLRDLGYVAGRNLVVDIRYARGDSSRLPALADELIALKPDVLFGIEQVAVVMRTRTTSIPIVLPSSADPVAAGLVQSLRRPGTNVTGMASLADQLVAKHIELLTEIVPKISRVALFNDPLAPAAARFEQFARTASTVKGLTLIVVGARDPEGVRQAFATLEKERPEGIVVVGTGRTNQLRHEIIGHARRLRLPSISALPGVAWAEAGGLITYAANLLESYRDAARYVDRILKGANPAEIPVEQSARFEFVVNLRTAREIGVTIPPSILLRADRVIE